MVEESELAKQAKKTKSKARLDNFVPGEVPELFEKEELKLAAPGGPDPGEKPMKSPQPPAKSPSAKSGERAGNDYDKALADAVRQRVETEKKRAERAAGKSARATASNETAEDSRKDRAAVANLVQRQSRWETTWAAMKYISNLSRDDDARIRSSDRATSVFLLIATVLTVVSLVLPALAPHRLFFVLICDALVGAMLALYLANRFGILNTLTPRQALLTWQLIMGATFIGIFVTINLAVAIALAVSHGLQLMP
jgi:hypothetical protein